MEHLIGLGHWGFGTEERLTKVKAKRDEARKEAEEAGAMVKAV